MTTRTTGGPPCSGQWALFDSRRPLDHWRARAICVTCPLLETCKPPENITMPVFPGAPGRPSTRPALASGTWGGRLYRNGEVVSVPLPAPGVVCALCGARADQRCRTPAGNSVPNHSVRIGPVMCQCGRSPVEPRGQYCLACRALARRTTYSAREDRTPTSDRRRAA